MVQANEVVLNLLACLESPHILAALEKKDYMVKIDKLDNYDSYIENPSFKDKCVTKENLQKCFNFTVKRLSEESVRIFMEKNKICFVTFYKKNTKMSNPLDKKTGVNVSNIGHLTNIIVKHEVAGKDLIVYIHPVAIYKARIMSGSYELIQHFKNNNENVENLVIKYIYKDTPIDALGEKLINLGYTIN